MKNYILLVALFLCSNTLFAQSQHATCGSADYLMQLENQYPGLQAMVENITTHSNYKTRATEVWIPVVFHVVYNSAAENIASTYINAQIHLLNETFGRQNSDTTNTRAIFKPVAGASKIRFMLSQIIRVSTTKTSFDVSSTSGMTNSDQVKETAYGGSDAISPNTKLNIWVCDLTKDGTDLLAGYAYPPVAAPLWPAGSAAPDPIYDGVVIDYLAVGGPLKQPLGASAWGFRGKTLVHEIGHYLGIRHTWGDDGGKCQGQTGFKDDGINDTPITSDNSNFNCNKSQNTCIEASGDLPDMVENYMDYSDETCQNVFTKMQVSAMEFVLDNIRSNVRIPLGINPTEELIKKVSLYPNPVADILYADINNVEYNSVKISLCNTIGQTLSHIEQTKSLSPIEINTSNLPKGIYFVNLIFDNSSAITKKVIVN